MRWYLRALPRIAPPATLIRKRLANAVGAMRRAACGG
jgi:hypothetical protein